MQSLTGCLQHWANEQPDRVLYGLIGADGKPGECDTYRAFLAGTYRLAAHLSRNCLLARGDRVLLVYPAGLDLMRAFFACIRVGIIPVPVVPPGMMGITASMARVQSIASDCQAAAVLSTAAMAPRIAEWYGRSGASPLLRCVATDGDFGATDVDVQDDPHPILFLQYTSGSTANPRGVMVSHENVLQNARGVLDHRPICVSWLPQFHDMGLIGYRLFPLVWGGSSYGLAPLDFMRRPAAWLQAISRVRATCSSSPNFGFEYCLEPGRIREQDLSGVDLSCLRMLMNAAEPVRWANWRRFIERFRAHGLATSACVVAYGLAENTLCATTGGRRALSLDAASLGMHRIAAVEAGPDAERSGHLAGLSIASCGRPVPGVRLRVVDPVSRKQMDARKIGEIWLSGPSVCGGYWGAGEGQGTVFGQALAVDGRVIAHEGEGDGEHTYLRTGDLGFMDDGELFVCGRIKDVIIVRGANLHPQDVESAALSALPQGGTDAVAAFSSKDAELTILVESRRRKVRPDLVAIASAVRAACLVDPDVVALVSPHSIVRTSSGKIARAATRERFCAGLMECFSIYRRTTKQNPLTLRGGVEPRLTARLEELLARSGPVDTLSTTLADLGFDSLTLTELLLQIEHEAQRGGASELIDELDVSLLQRLSIHQLKRLVADLDDGSPGLGGAVRNELRASRIGFEQDIRAKMRHDARLQFQGNGDLSGDRSPITDVLFTGATGFFGPFLLARLLARTPFTFHVLVRADSDLVAIERLDFALSRAVPASASRAALWGRLRVVRGDLSQPNLGLRDEGWDKLTQQVQMVVHNGAAVNYVANYEALKPHNIDGTSTLLRLAFTGARKRFHFVSTTFIFGWTARGLLLESDNNDAMENLDFGYAQTKWVSEQLVRAALARGLDAHIYRPSLISVSTEGSGDQGDVAIRLIAFMIRYGVAVRSANQISILAADRAADNIAAILCQREAAKESSRTFHVTVDRYYNMADITAMLTRNHGYEFTYYDIPAFIEQMNRLCTRNDPLFPLLDFFNRSAPKIAAMQLKRYRNDIYNEARGRADTKPDPELDVTVGYIVQYLRHLNWIDERVLPAGDCLAGG